MQTSPPFRKSSGQPPFAYGPKTPSSSAVRLIIAAYCLVSSALLLLLCTKSSPLYPLNDWVDANSFFTMGKGMAHGLVPYRDLFEQKGPLLYFIHTLAYWISDRSFLGVYVFETISFAFFLYYIHKIVALFLDVRYSLLALPFFAAVMLNLPSFTHGDSAEEFTMPLLAFSLYALLRYFKETYPDPPPYAMLLANGVAAGMAMWIKYSLLGFWFGWMAALFFCIVLNRRFLRSLLSCGAFLGGMALSSLPWIVYFGVQRAIPQWIDAYILANFRFYGKESTLEDKVWLVIYRFRDNLLHSPMLLLTGLLAIFFVFGRKYLPPLAGRLSLLTTLAFLVLGVYGGGRGYVYYFMVIAPFTVFGWIVLLDLLRRATKDRLTFRFAAAVPVLGLLIVLPLTYLFNGNVPMMKVAREDLAQNRFARIIEQTPNATLLNYGSLDRGLYTTTGIVPNYRYFQKQNFAYASFPENMDEQRRYIRERSADFVLTSLSRQDPDPDSYPPPELAELYDSVARQEQVFEGETFVYTLYQLKK
ncbi:hypothetical protein CDO73_18185 [Saccharibacillus sp. O23]|uniref:ArnT family glycosyltransferase n=1 Tax=Saccharibacillus sp. O23 TaxID=2009338 RepID=UPI000B4E65C5|nr:hypothetical protein [Saccharibacillus sp. O23]OWR28480.1 hypothetical protein CDO73_18185 [Saccharibacillus sp. O23]